MGRQAAIVFYGLALIAVVVGVDVLFFRNRFWARLMVTVGIVLVFAAFYLTFLKPWKRHPRWAPAMSAYDPKRTFRFGTLPTNIDPLALNSHRAGFTRRRLHNIVGDCETRNALDQKEQKVRIVGSGFRSGDPACVVLWPYPP